MDYREFEQNVADYVEGALEEGLRCRMDAARAVDPACDRLARLHEQLLVALQETPELEAPAGLAERIFAKAENLEQLLAAEQRAFRRGMWLGVAGAALGATALAVLLFVLDLSTGSGTLDATATAGNNWIAQVSYKLYEWFGSAEALMKSEIVLPVVGGAVPVYVLLISAAVTALLAWFRDDILDALTDR